MINIRKKITRALGDGDHLTNNLSRKITILKAPILNVLNGLDLVMNIKNTIILDITKLR